MTLKTLAAAAFLTMALGGAASAATLNSADISLSGGSLNLNADDAAVPSTNTLTIGNASLSVNLLTSSTFEIVYDLGSFPAIVGTSVVLDDFMFDVAASITGASLTSGDGALASVSTTASAITVNISNYSVPPANQVETWQFAFTNEADMAPVPLPAGGLLLLSAFGAVVALKRRKKHAA